MFQANIEEKCVQCGIESRWNGRHLVLHVDHIDGCRLNNGVENLRFLCPNCHSQTDTYAGRNKRRGHHPFTITESEIYKFLNSLDDITRHDYFLTTPTQIICDKFHITVQTISRYKKIFKITSKFPTSYQSRSPSKEQLTEDVKNMSMVAVGRKYGVTDNAVRRWCKKYGIDKSMMKFSHKSSVG